MQCWDNEIGMGLLTIIGRRLLTIGRWLQEKIQTAEIKETVVQTVVTECFNLLLLFSYYIHLQLNNSNCHLPSKITLLVDSDSQQCQVTTLFGCCWCAENRMRRTYIEFLEQNIWKRHNVLALKIHNFKIGLILHNTCVCVGVCVCDMCNGVRNVYVKQPTYMPWCSLLMLKNCIFHPP